LLFAAKFNGEVSLTVEEQGVWSRWTRAAWGRNGPKSFRWISLCKIDVGLQFCAVDGERQLWSTTLFSNGAQWGPWEEPSWINAPPLIKVAAVQTAGPRIIWGIKASDDSLVFSHGPAVPGEQWGPWQPWPATGLPDRYHLIDITATLQDDGRAQLWALDNGFRLRSCYENTAGGSWTNWSPPNWQNAPELFLIAACRQGATNSAALAALQKYADGRYTHWDRPKGGWMPWSELPGRGMVSPETALTATRQSNGTVRLWVVELRDFELSSIAQTSPDGGWGQWETWPLPPG
jgi:hypothetical protein